MCSSCNHNPSNDRMHKQSGSVNIAHKSHPSYGQNLTFMEMMCINLRSCSILIKIR